MAAVKSALQGTLAGATESEADPNPSAQTRANFEKYARIDESGESYITEEEFVDAIVPKDEDFVGSKLFRCVAVQGAVDRQLRLTCSIKSNGGNMGSYFVSPIAIRLAELLCGIGPFSKIS